MKILKANNSQSDSLKNKVTSSRLPLAKNKERPEFDFILEEFLNAEAREWDEYPVLLPRHGRFWDNGYEDVE